MFKRLSLTDQASASAADTTSSLSMYSYARFRPQNRMNTIESRLKALQGQLYESSASATPPSPTSPAFSRITPEKADQEKVVGEKDAKAASKEGEVLEEKAAAAAVAASKTTPEVVTTTLTKTTTTKGKVEKTEALAVTSGTTVTSSVTSVIQNVIKFEGE